MNGLEHLNNIMKIIQIAFFVILSVLPLSIYGNSPQKYRVSYKVSQKLPDSFGKVKMYINDVSAREIKESPKTHKVENPEKPIVLSFVSVSNFSNHFSITLPAPASVEGGQYKVFEVELFDRYTISAKVNMSLKKSDTSVSTVIYTIELEGKDGSS